EKKMAQYSEVYRERPATIYIAPLVDHAERRAVRVLEDSLYNVSVNVATKQLYLTASDPLVFNGYYVLGPLASAQLAATETRTVKQLRNENINDYYTDLGIDAVLFLTVNQWSSTHNSWTVEVEYSLRSTRTGSEVMHTVARATKMLHTDFKGNPKPLGEDLDFAKKYGCDLETAQRCRLVELLNQYVLKDLPSGSRARGNSIERHTGSHAEYFNLQVNPDGSVMLVPSDEDL
ncbi:MAG: hypothetical protein IK058_03795, partial [Bacteroidales bacterium]|nr:hypothetical protein [Bacteroidales bacterium]